jgi:hypothetical protein
MKLILESDKECPLNKLSKITKIISTFKDDLVEQSIERSDILSILIYCLIKANVVDLRA